MKVKLGKRFDELFPVFESNDAALEWCENELLTELESLTAYDHKLKPADYLLFQGLTPAELAAIAPLLEPHSYKHGHKLISAGDAAREVFFLSRGAVSVLLPGAEHRLATFSPGMSFGEMAFIDGAPRSANIIADTDVECHMLTLEDFQRLGKSHPEIKIKLLERLALDLCGKLRKANRELSVFD
jgi:glutaminase